MKKQNIANLVVLCYNGEKQIRRVHFLASVLKKQRHKQVRLAQEVIYENHPFV